MNVWSDIVHEVERFNLFSSLNIELNNNSRTEAEEYNNIFFSQSNTSIIATNTTEIESERQEYIEQ